MTNRYAIIKDETNEVINIVDVEPEESEKILNEYTGCYMIQNDNARVGLIWNKNTKEFINPYILNRVITPYQMRSVLVEYEIYDDVIAMIEASTDQKLKIAWEYAIEIRRNSPLIAAAGALMNLTEAQIDEMFEEASKIV